MAHSEHISLAKSGASAIARWRELNYRIPNPTQIQYGLSYQLENRSVSETFEPEMVFGRAKLDLSGAFLSGAKLAGADLAHDDLRGADLTGSNLRLAALEGASLNSAHLSRSNLSRANLTRANMAGCSLVRSNLSSSTLQSADLTGANLSFSNLSYTNLEGANLSGANLSYTDLSWANLSRANLQGVNLTAASLMMADLNGADLRGAEIINSNLDSAIFYNTVLGITKLINCDLSTIIGLDMARHAGPSTIGLDSIARSGGTIPKRFLENAGVAAPLIAAQDALRGVARKYPTVLIIGSIGDSELATRIHSGLVAAQIPCWSIAPDDEAAERSGEMILSNSIYYDRLVLLCTAQALESSLTSQHFAELAGGQRPESNQTVMVLAADELFYGRDDRLCNTLKEGQVLDFRGWEDAKVYEESLISLVKSLSQERS